MQTGAIALMTALLLPILFGFGAFVIDLARLYVYKTEIQNAMDACALGASLALTGVNDATIFDRARAYGKVMTDPSAAPEGVARAAASVNRLHFQKDSFDQANILVEYSTALSGAAWVAATAASTGGLDPTTVKYARCRYEDPDNPLFFMPLLKVVVPGAADKLTVAAVAAAALTPAQSACAFPVAMCAAAGSNAANDWGLIKGARYSSVTSPGAALSTGNFGWLDFTPPSGGAAELEALMVGSGSCAVSVGTPVGQEGYAASLQDPWNTRFGVYKNGGGPGAYTKTSAPPDLTGISYPPTGVAFPTPENNYASYVTAAAGHQQFQGGLPGGFSRTTDADHGAFGKKRRVVAAAIVNCAGFAGSGKPPVLDFACILLLSPTPSTGNPAWSQVSPTLDVEFIGRASEPGTPCASSGMGGGAFGPPIPTLVQ
jgi:hypothetical protein